MLKERYPGRLFEDLLTERYLRRDLWLKVVDT